MPSHENQHYVPVFLLQEWHTGSDEKLSYFRWAHGELVTKRRKAKSVAKQWRLLSLVGVPESERNSIERDFMGPLVDDPAAIAHRTILTAGVPALKADAELREAWSRFLVSLMHRTPDRVALIRAKGRDKLREGFDAVPEEYAAVRGDDPAETLWDWLQQNKPHDIENFGIRIIPQLVDSEPVNNVILGGHWAVMPLDGCRLNLLIGDRPLLYIGKMSERFVLALPIAPRRLFVAVDSIETWQRAQSESANSIVRKVNIDTIAHAMHYVYATNTTQQPFIEQHLRRP